MQASFKNRLKNGETLVGTIITLPSPEVAELLSKSGFDWLFIDMEHSAITIKDAQRMIQAASEHAHCILRVPGNEEIWIKRSLDTGAEGIIIPQVNSKTEAEKAVNHSKYPPQGKRSIGISRAHDFGIHFTSYIEHANEEIALIIQCEHTEAVRNLPEILQVDGIDCIFTGPYDLSASMGKTGNLHDPEVTKAIAYIQQQCQHKNMPQGIFGGSTTEIKPFKNNGGSLLAVGIDVLMLSGSAKEIVSQMLE